MPDPRPFHALRLAALLFTFSAAAVRAEEASAPPKVFRQSIGISPFAVLGGIDGNYEYLVSDRHGLVAEGGYAVAGASKGSYHGGAGYRFHFTPGMESGFLGIFVRYGRLKGEAEGEVNDQKTRFAYETPLFAIGPNIGTKWQWDNGLAMTLRGGYGYAVSDLEWSPTEPEPKFIGSLVETLLGLDAEFTLGYSF